MSSPKFSEINGGDKLSFKTAFILNLTDAIFFVSVWAVVGLLLADQLTPEKLSSQLTCP